MIKPPSKVQTKLSNIALFDDDDDEISKFDGLISISDISLPQQQPRRYFDPVKMQELQESIRHHGILEPILVRPLGDGYELVAGERRLRAAKELELKEIPAIIHELTTEKAYEIALIENLQREELNPVEETEAILQILSLRLTLPEKEVVSHLYKMRVTPEQEREDAFAVISNQVISIFDSLQTIKWESFVVNRLPLLNLPEEVLEALRQGQIEYTKATAIATVKDIEKRQSLLKEAINSGLSLLQIKEKIRDIKAGQITLKPVTLKTRFTNSMQQLKKSAIWDDRSKQKSLEKLILQIEALLG
ncbi:MULTISPECIES: ParB/RepB/Spo0J family partition protein [Pseudanabaena]|uniref:ParB family protein n=2 Tax=Pseudanabaena TaxID=1152 RepID=L8N1U1_9CYAN|nr:MULTISPECIES: ParB/RepB/Spo0J family partition protein [Pseudanabaena]ELS33676.1 ParB family protein [Pseudanabaena biceps PCC 7429]MDG3494116.1 ParB/RepB/Spo0J family partition protein [Pseudanabaena catenata USMAC16]